MNKIGLFFHKRTKVDGMNKVVWNLMKGLNQLGIPYSENVLEKYNGCLQGGVPNYMSLPLDTLMGVNLMEIPSDDPKVWARYDNFVTCSDWVYKKYTQFEETLNKRIHVWASGIDTERFHDNNKKPTQDCFVYYKDITKHINNTQLREVERELTRRRLSYSVIKYGSYTEDQLIDTVNRSRFCILMTGTESQGIAQMEIMSMGCPLYVFNQTFWQKRGQEFSFDKATSIPYWDDRCGTVVDGINFSRFDDFLNSINGYHPRDYITENFTLLKSAMEYNLIIKGAKV